MDISIINVKNEHTTWSYETPNWSMGLPLLMGDTYRHGGGSESPYGSLNLAFHVGDNPDAVIKNRQIIADYLNVPSSHVTCANQVHGLTAVRITSDLVGAGAFGEITAIQDCDALYTNVPNVPLLLFTADCVGVGIYDAKRHATAVVHAGWRGAIGHLPALTIEAMHEDFGTEPEDCYIYLGPSIGPESFEVNEELATAFITEWKRMTEQEDLHDVSDLVRYIQRPGATHSTPHINLWRFIEESLIQQGVPKSQICIGGTDSMTSEDCFSYRREVGKTGRMALFTMLRSR